MHVVDYDQGHYSYEDYWANREYEHLAELHAIKRLVVPYEGWIADFGGGFGRLSPAYLPTHRRVAIVDYSLNLLQSAQKRLGAGPERLYVAANLYRLPFRRRAFASAMTVRVLHHLNAYSQALREIDRVVQQQWVLEIPNKRHGLARIRSWWQDGAQSERRGPYPINVATGDQGTFLNYHPRTVIHQLRRAGWIVAQVRSVSNFRSAVLKRRISAQVLSRVDGWAQRPLAGITWGPSMMYQLLRPYQGTEVFNDWHDMLFCPRCQGSFRWTSTRAAHCIACGETFQQIDGIWDLRWPRPSTKGS